MGFPRVGSYEVIASGQPEFFPICVVFAAQVGHQRQKFRTVVESAQMRITPEQEIVGQAHIRTFTEPLDGLVGLAAHCVG